MRPLALEAGTILSEARGHRQRHTEGLYQCVGTITLRTKRESAGSPHKAETRTFCA
jgi:hypothetical protein